MDLQKMLDAASEMDAKTRSGYHLTLVGLIDALEAAPEGAEIGIGKPHSYRGYYRDLAFETCDPRPVADVLEEARGCLDKLFTGYKGGDFEMSAGTALWIAEWGCCGDAFMGVDFSDGVARLHTKCVDF